MTDDPGATPEPFAVLKDRGAGPTEVYSEARRRGVAKVEGMQLLRGLYALSFAEARAVSWEVDGYPDHVLRPIRDHGELIAVLTEELGYCGCAHAEDAVRILRVTLEHTRDRREAFGRDPAEGAADRAAAALRADLGVDSMPGLATWFLYFLDHRGFVEHAGNVMGCWITDKDSSCSPRSSSTPAPRTTTIRPRID